MGVIRYQTLEQSDYIYFCDGMYLIVYIQGNMCIRLKPDDTLQLNNMIVDSINHVMLSLVWTYYDSVEWSIKLLIHELCNHII